MKSNRRTASRLNSQIGMLMLLFSVLLPTIETHAEAANESIGRVGNTVELAEITVTARSLKEPQREVPFSISVFDSGTLEGSRIFQTEDLFRSAPNFNFTDSGIPEANLLNIRGVGSSSTFLSPSVVYYIDGVPVQARAFDTQFLDVAQIEILRGPQGTLFGQSAQAGAVHITTKAPVSESEVAINGSYGSYDAARLTTAVTGALSEDLTGRISVVYFERDGDIDNATFTAPGVFTSEEVIRERESLGVSGKLQYTPTSSTRLTLSGSIQTDDQNPTTGLLVNDDVFPINALNPIPENELDVYRASLRLEHDIGDIEFTSITGYEHYDLGLLADISDGFIASANTGFSASAFAFPNNIRNIDEDSTQLSQEFCFHGEYGNTSTWVGGLSGLHSDFESSTAVTSIALPSGTYTGEVERNNVAVFGETTYALTDDLRIIAGARVTWEESRLDGKWIGSGPPSVASFNESGAFDSVFATGRLGVSFDLNERLTTFATIARGEKPGGFPFFNQGAAFANPIDAFGEATTWSYEAGLKGSFADGKFSFAASIFYNDNSDEQFFIFNPLVGQFQVENANSETYGLEFEAEARPLDRLRLRTALGFLHAEATDDSSGGSVLDGNDVPYAPSFTSSFSGEYTLPLEWIHSDGSIILYAEYQFVDDRQIDPSNNFELDSYNIVNARIAYRLDNMEIYVFGENIFDEEYVQSGFSAGLRPGTNEPVIGGVPGLPASFGIGASISF